jgi:hypothetical protein
MNSKFLIISPRVPGAQMTMSAEDMLRLKAPGVMQRREKPREEAYRSRLSQNENIRRCGSRRGRQQDGNIPRLCRRRDESGSMRDVCHVFSNDGHLDHAGTRRASRSGMRGVVISAEISSSTMSNVAAAFAVRCRIGQLWREKISRIGPASISAAQCMADCSNAQPKPRRRHAAATMRAASAEPAAPPS